MDKYFGDYLKVKGHDYWIERSSVIWIDKISTEEILTETQNATKVGTKYTSNETSVACNICVRSALFLLREEQVLFPKAAHFTTLQTPLRLATLRVQSLIQEGQRI